MRPCARYGAPWTLASATQPLTGIIRVRGSEVAGRAARTGGRQPDQPERLRAHRGPPAANLQPRGPLQGARPFRGRGAGLVHRGRWSSLARRWGKGALRSWLTAVVWQGDAFLCWRLPGHPGPSTRGRRRPRRRRRQRSDGQGRRRGRSAHDALPAGDEVPDHEAAGEARYGAYAISPGVGGNMDRGW